MTERKYPNKTFEWMEKFVDKFGYTVKTPDGLYLDNDDAEVNREFIDTLKRSVETGFKSR